MRRLREKNKKKGLRGTKDVNTEGLTCMSPSATETSTAQGTWGEKDSEDKKSEVRKYSKAPAAGGSQRCITKQRFEKNHRKVI